MTGGHLMMMQSKFRLMALGPALGFALVGSACGDSAPPVAQVAESALTADQRLVAWDQDPRVIPNVVGRESCAGADIFFRGTFNGNGRTCGPCHPAQNNFTIDAA